MIIEGMVDRRNIRVLDSWGARILEWNLCRSLPCAVVGPILSEKDESGRLLLCPLSSIDILNGPLKWRFFHVQ